MATKDVKVTDDNHIGIIAAQNGTKDWRSLWVNDSALQSKRDDPLILFSGLEKQTDDTGHDVAAVPGDTIKVKDLSTKNESGATDAHHVFELKVVKVKLRVRVLNEKLKPIQNAKYRLIVDGIRRPFGTTGLLDSDFDANGMIDVAVPEMAHNGVLIVSYKPDGLKEKDKDWPKDIQGVDVAVRGAVGPPAPAPPAPPPVQAPPVAAGPLTQADAQEKADAKEEAETVEIQFALQIGRLDPIKDKTGAPDTKFVSGMQQRLNNLGFEAGHIDGLDDDEFKAAVKRFQKRFQMDPADGVSNAATQQKMVDFYTVETSVAPVPA